MKTRDNMRLFRALDTTNEATEFGGITSCDDNENTEHFESTVRLVKEGDTWLIREAWY